MKAVSLFSARRRIPSLRPGAPPASGSLAAEAYKPLLEIGRGGMGVVTLALSRGPDQFAKLVVLKRLHEHLLEDPSSIQMLLDEARISARLAHPNVVQVYEVTQHRGAPTIVMEYLEGLPLPELTQPPVPLPLALHLSVLVQVLRGLDAAHELHDYDGKPLSLVHRDMSPHNVFVGYDGVVKVLDFGIAKVVGSDEGATRTGVLKGKLRYMAPEQVAGGELDRRSDLFSVGVMLWEAISGQRLWADAVDGQVVRNLIQGNIPRLPGGDVDPRLARVCERALAIDPNGRYPTAAEFRRELQTFLEARSGELLDEALGQFLAQHYGHRRDEMRARIAERIQRTTSRPPRAADGSGLESERSAFARWLTSRVRLAAAGALLVAALAALVLLVPRLTARGHPAAGIVATGAAAPPVGSLPELQCEPGFKPCDGRCVSSDRPEHGCGAASCTPCLRANATARCDRDGRCGIAVCYRGYDDCDGSVENGCETFLRTDPRHCGACGAACAPLPHAEVGCGDTCRVWRCEAGHEDCNGAKQDGCEAAVGADPQHCGSCGKRCAPHQRCHAGRCGP